ncbi:MAG: hypothetical protein ACRD7E_13390 [Bryobacteraceae bacterium]
MQFVILCAGLAMTAAALAAQVSARLNHLADGTTQIVVTNDGAIELVAFALSATESNGVIRSGRLVVSKDVVAGDDVHLLPDQTFIVNESRRWNGRGAVAKFEPHIKTAGILATARRSAIRSCCIPSCCGVAMCFRLLNRLSTFSLKLAGATTLAITFSATSEE